MISSKTYLYTLIVIIIAIIYMTRYRKNKQDEKYIEVMYFYTDWCVFCKKFNPEWIKFKQLSDTTNNIRYIEINEELNNTKYLNYKITEYPTILINYNNIITEYTEDRIAENIHKYIIEKIK